MNKTEKINAFLDFWVEIAKSNPNYQFNSSMSTDCIYNSLVHLGVKEEDKGVNLKDAPSKLFPNVHTTNFNNDLFNSNSTFGNLINNYKNSRKTNVYVTLNLKKFLQFVSRDLKAKRMNNHIKVYIPLDSDHIELGTKLIMDFLENNNISHFSKMSRRIRFDDLVIRLINSEDAIKLINFVNNNNYIKNGLIEPNPFAFNKNGISLAVDGCISYNGTIAGLIDLYMDECKSNNRLDRVNADDFYRFVFTKYKGQFIDKNDNSIYYLFRCNKEELRKNYREVISLILKSYNPLFTFHDLIEHYNLCIQDDKKDMLDINKTNNLLVETIVTMTKKYNEFISLNNVEAYLHNGEARLITQTDGLRNRIVNSKFRESMIDILRQKNISYRDYVSYILDEYNIDLKAIDTSRIIK